MSQTTDTILQMPRVQQHYPKAPIAEAVIDIQVKASSDATLITLEDFCETEKQKYPERRNLREATAELRLTPGTEPSSSATQVQTGYMCLNAAKVEIIQAKLNGFTFSRLSPYESWDVFETEGRRLWTTYRELIRPTEITRVAVRYVNRIDIPLPIKDFKDYFRTIPEVSNDLPQGLSGFFMQLHVPMEDVGCMLLLNEALIPPAKEGVVSVALDIDLFRTQSIPQSEEELWRLFSVLHDRKNEVFEGCITDKTRILFT